MPAIGLNFVGFVIPLLVSSLITITLAGYRRFKISRNSLFGYLVVFVIVTAISLILFQIAPDPLSLSIPQSWSLAMMVSSGLIYSIFFAEKRLISIGLLEAYSMGTFAMMANDAFRTFFTSIPGSPSIAYWGGSGANDLIVQFGFFAAASFTTFAGSLAIWRRSLVRNLVGEKWASVFWTRIRTRKANEQGKA